MKLSFLRVIKKRWKSGTFGDIFADWKWIASYSRRFKWRVMLYTALGIISSSLGLLSAIAGKFLLDVIIGHKADQLWLAALVTAGSALLMLGINNLTGRIRQRLDVDMTCTIRSDVFASVMDAEWQSLNQFSNGDILNRFHSDISAVSSNAVGWLPSVIISLYSFIATFIVIWHYNPVMSLIALSSAPVVLLTSRYLINKQKAFRDEMMQATSGIYSFETETLYNLDMIKSFGIADYFSMQLKELQMQHRRITLAWNMFQIRTNIFMALLSLLVEYAAYGYALFLLWGGHITYGTMTLFLQQRNSMSAAFQGLIGIVPAFINGSVSARRLQELTNLPKEKHLKSEIPAEYFHSGVTLKLNKVSFSYDDGKNVLENSDFEAHPGQITALVGPSGEGKTTVLRLLLGIIVPESGSCTFISGVNNALPVSPESRALISYVPQGNTLLTGTIAENMRLAKHDATDAEIIDALQLACAWEFVRDMPQGINSSIHERGKGLSEGQAQRISIARGLLKNAPILLLDEATSALDMDTERKVLNNILKAAQNRTCILTTHRPSALSMCDRAYKVQDNSIVWLDSQEIRRIINGELS